MHEKKRKLRREITKKLKALSKEELEARSRAVTKNLLTTEAWGKAEVVLAFISMNGEIETKWILQQAWNEGKDVAVPRMREGNSMDFHLVDGMDGPWEHHDYGIKEPAGTLPILVPTACPDRNVLIVTPGLAFDRNMNRLGRGKGFYDCYLSMDCSNVTAIGICFDFQIVDSVPVTENDWPLDGIITDSQILLP